MVNGQAEAVAIGFSPWVRFILLTRSFYPVPQFRCNRPSVRLIQHLAGDLGLNMERSRRLLALLPCWELMPCSPEDRRACIAMRDPIHPCWMTKKTECARKGINCRECNVYRNAAYCTPVMKALLYDAPDSKSNETLNSTTTSEDR